MLGEINTDIGQAQNPLSQQFSYILMDFGLVDLLRHFQQLWQFCHLKMWYQVRQGSVANSM